MTELRKWRVNLTRVEEYELRDIPAETAEAAEQMALELYDDHDSRYLVDYNVWSVRSELEEE